jgi:hypothetical protein
MSKKIAQADIPQESLLFRCSGFMFRLGLALEIFEEVRPFGVLFADLFFLVSLILLLCSKERSLLVSRGSGVMAASALILSRILVSGVMTGSALKVIILFGAFAPLALAHSRDLWRNLRYLVAGVTVNCAIAIISAWFWPGIVKMLAVNPTVTDIGQQSGRYAGLSGHPNSLGISAALAVLVAVGLLLHAKGEGLRIGTYLQILICLMGAVLSNSRTFFVALLPPLLILVFWRRLSFKRVVRLSFGLICLLWLSWVAIDHVFPSAAGSYMERLGDTSASDEANQGRLLTASLALLEISQKPIWGWGPEHLGEAGMVYLPGEADFEPVHVVFLHYWYAEGILGAVGFALLFVLPVVGMFRILRNSHAESMKEASRLGICACVCIFISSNLHPLFAVRHLFMPLFVFAGILTLNPRRSQERTLLSLSQDALRKRARLDVSDNQNAATL